MEEFDESAVFHPSSLNTIRVVRLSKDDKCEVAVHYLCWVLIEVSLTIHMQVFFLHQSISIQE